MAVDVNGYHHSINKEQSVSLVQRNSLERQTSTSNIYHAPNVTSASQWKVAKRSNLSNKETQSESISQLPSYVSESPDIYNLEGRREPSLDSLPLDGAQEVRKMSTQNDLVNGTQQLSQSIYDNIILRSKSVSVPEDVQDLDMRYDHSTGTQHTLNEGDEGHIDITSSFPSVHDVPEDLMDSEPVLFSPSQHRQTLTQFPESQRFKTPATAGKKRNYKGDTIETPSLPRNPLARNGAPTPSRMMGLSQAFADTQAVSSPLSNGLATILRSDRPSPNIEMQTKVAAPSSSPLSLLPNIRRAVTEPSTRYIPMKESQAEREYQVQRERENENNDDSDSDDFGGESSSARRRRRERERDQRFRIELRGVSHPPSPLHTSSGLDKRGTRSSPIRPSETSPVIRPASSPDADQIIATPYAKIADPGLESEVETEQEDEDGINVRRSSQLPIPGEEGKENQVRFVQETVVQLQRVVNGSISQVEASPCIRYSSNMPANGHLYSSEPLRIADSQPSQPYRNIGRSKNVRSSGSEVADFGHQNPQSGLVETRSAIQSLAEQTDSREIQDGTVDLVSPTPQHGDIGMNVDDESNHNEETLNGERTSVIVSNPEHVNGLNGPSSESALGKQVTNVDNTSTAGQIHQSLPTDVSTSQLSSQPVIRTPARSRRRRMMEVSANNSPLNLTPNFNAAQALQLDADEGMVGFLETSPQRIITYSHKRRRVENKLAQSKITPREFDAEADRVASPKSATKRLDEVQFDLQLEDAPELSQEIIQPTRQRRSAHLTVSHSSPGPSAPTRRSVWELDPSPVKVKVAETNFSKKGLLKSRSRSKLEERIQPTLSVTTPKATTTAVIIENDSPDPLGINLPSSAVTAATPSIHDGDIARPNMVFAFFNGTLRAYYPAVYLGHAGTTASKFRIQWEGYDPDEVDSYGVKALDLRIGDVVKINLKQFPKVPYIIRGFKDKVQESVEAITDIRGYRTLIITPKPRKNTPARITIEPQKEVPISAVYLDSQMWQQMKNRDFDFIKASKNAQSILATPVLQSGTPGTPTSRHKRQAPSSVVDSPFIQTQSGIFARMAFAISYESTARKNTLVDLIQANGGLVLENSFHDLLETDSLELKPHFADLGFTVLLTERHSRKEKYMHALALGLPCLNGRWIEACVQKESVVDWQPYLLPAGESEELEGATRSRILPPMNPSTTKLSDVLKARVNLFDNVPVVVVVGRGKVEIKRAPYAFLIQALGAGRLEKVPDIKTAQEVIESDPSCRYVFVDDKDLEMARSLITPSATSSATATAVATEKNVKSSSSRAKSQGKKSNRDVDEIKSDCIVAGNELIVQSLILGKLYTC